jgi:hypothetical protein
MEYGLSLCGGGRIEATTLAAALALLECGPAVSVRRRELLEKVDALCVRGMRYANEDFDVLSSALNFLDAVQPDVAEQLRYQAAWREQRAGFAAARKAHDRRVHGV